MIHWRWDGDARMAVSKEYKTYIEDCLSRVGNVKIRPMMGGYLVYYRGRLVGDIADGILLLKHTPASDRLLAGSEEAYPYAESKTIMWVIENPENTALLSEVLEGMYPEVPEKKR